MQPFALLLLGISGALVLAADSKPPKKTAAPNSENPISKIPRPKKKPANKKKIKTEDEA